MKKNLLYTFDEHLEEELKDLEFSKIWEETKVEYSLASQLIAKRISKKMSQRALAKKLNTTQAVISRIETMNGNPSLSLLKRIAKALDVKLSLEFK